MGGNRSDYGRPTQQHRDGSSSDDRRQDSPRQDGAGDDARQDNNRPRGRRNAAQERARANKDNPPEARRGSGSARRGRRSNPKRSGKPQKPRHLRSARSTTIHGKPVSMDEKEIRVHVLLAHQGYGSRRACEEIVASGRVTVNGKKETRMGVKVVPGKDEVAVDGKVLSTIEHRVYLAFNKPPGTICTMDDPEGRTRVVDLLPADAPRVFPVGRLDYNSAGLLLLTNDGKFANWVMHPRFQHEKVYHVKINGMLEEEHLERLLNGMVLDGEQVKGVTVLPIQKTGKNWWYQMTLTEGRNRQIRRSIEALGFLVSKLIRVQIGPVTVDGIPEGEWRELKTKEIAQLGYSLPGHTE